MSIPMTALLGIGGSIIGGLVSRLFLGYAGGFVFAFLGAHPEHRRVLATDPSLIPGAVEELLRWESPVPMVFRTAAIDTTKMDVQGLRTAGFPLVMSFSDDQRREHGKSHEAEHAPAMTPQDP